jgi:hypothetical protein
MSYNTSNYTEQGGARTVIGGSLDVASGGDLDIESGGALKIAGTAVTASAAELNIVDGVTATAAEVNVLAGVTAGTVTASKAVVVDASKDIATLGAVGMGALTCTTIAASGLIAPDAAAGAASANGLILGNGTTADPCLNAVADKHFIEFRMKHTATSGDNRGIYTRTEFAGAGGGGDGIRSNTIANEAIGTVQGIHGSVEFKAGASCTGLTDGIRAGLIFADEAGPGGTVCAQMVELWASGTSTDISGASVSMIRAVMGGDATGITNMDDNAFFIQFAGMTAGSGNMIDTSKTTHTAYGGVRVQIPGVGTKWLAVVSD